MLYSFKSYFIFISVLLSISLLFCMFIPTSYLDNNLVLSNSIFFTISNNSFPWPTPGYTTITSPFGRRVSPTVGASTFHSGVDIAAPTGTNIIAVCSGIVDFLDFNGAGGYTITIKNETFSVSYCHVSPNFEVFLGQKIKSGQVIR